MKQFLVAALLCAVLAAAAADKSFGFRRPVSFQRQTELPDDAVPPAPGGAAPGGAPGKPGGDAGGPYPPSGQPESGPYPPSGWKPEGQRLELPARQQKPQQQYGAPPKQPQQQYGAPPKQPQQQYGAPAAPAAEPEAGDAGDAPTEPATESPEVVASNRLRNQVRQQRLILQRMRQVVRDQQLQLERQRQEQQALVEQLQQLQQLRGVSVQQQGQGGELAPQQGQYVVNLPDGRVQRVQFASTPSSASVFKQNVLEAVPVQAPAAGPASHGQQSAPGFPSPDPQTYVARLQFMDVPPIDAPVFSYSGSGPLVRVA